MAELNIGGIIIMAELNMGTLYDANKSVMNARVEGTNEYKFKALNHV